MTRPTGGEGMGDDVYQPDGSEIQEDAGPLEPEDTLVDRGLGQVLDEGYSPPERPYAVEDTGTTAREQRTGESLERRLSREEPDEPPPAGDGFGDTSDTEGEPLDDEVGEFRSGRLVGPDEGAHPRREGIAGDDVGIDGGAAGAEEAAVHVVPDEGAGAMGTADEPETASPGQAAPPAAVPGRERAGRLRLFRRREGGDRAHHARAHRGDRAGAGNGDGHGRDGGGPPEGLAASLVTSGGMLLAMVEDIRMREANKPEDLRLLADTFARHNAAKEATVLKVLDRHHVAERVVERDRQEGRLLQDILDRALMGRHPSDTHTLTVDGALAQMYQYLFHERRDLVPALRRTVPPEEGEALSAAFEAIDRG